MIYRRKFMNLKLSAVIDGGREGRENGWPKENGGEDDKLSLIKFYLLN